MLSDLTYRLRALFRRNDVEQELQDELQDHLARETAKLERTGLSRAEAERQARVNFGGVEQVKEASRDGRGLSWLEAISQDLRYALRALRRTPGFTLAVVLTLGLGIGANAAMFGIVDRLLLRDPAMIKDADRSHRIYFASQQRGEEWTYSFTQYTRYQDLAKWTRSFDVLSAFSYRNLAVGSGQEAREMPVGIVSADFFALFDAPPHLGRYFNRTEDTIPRGAPVAVLAYGYWQREFAGSRDALGKSVKIGTVDYSVIGVAPKGFVGVPNRRDPIAFIPITSYAASMPMLSERYFLTYNWSWMEVLGRRKPGVTVEQADADLTQAYLRSWQAEVDIARRPDDVQTAAAAHPRAMVGPVLLERGPKQSEITKVAGWVVGVTGIVLLIACANVANLLLARAIGRRREIALRLALGVSRSRLALQLLTESLLLAGMGIIGGLAVAHYGDIILRRLFMPDGDLQSPLVDSRTLLFTVGITLFAGLITGIAPILQARRTDLNDALKASARQGGQHKSRTRTALVLVQGALSVVLLVGAGLFVRSLQQVRDIDLGFDVKPLVVLSPNLRGQQLTQPESDALNDRLVTIARGVPGVTSVSTVITTPFWDTWTSTFFVDGIDSVSKLGEFTLQASTPEYFRTTGTRILRGRAFDETDVATGPKVVVVSKAMAEALWPGKDALGQCIRFGDTRNVDCSTVIGVAQDIKQSSITNDGGLHYYFPLRQFVANQIAENPQATFTFSIFARVNGAGADYAESIRRQLQSAMPGEGYMTAETMSNIVGSQTRSWEVGSTMFLAFAGLALVLASIGLYSVIAYDVARRTQELGVRMALGAGVNDVVGMVMRDGVRFALLGLATGGLVAFVASPFLAPLLYRQPARDPLIFVGVGAVLLVIAMLASAIPALRASRVNPGVALRAE